MCGSDVIFAETGTKSEVASVNGSSNMKLEIETRTYMAFIVLSVGCCSDLFLFCIELKASKTTCLK